MVSRAGARRGLAPLRAGAAVGVETGGVAGSRDSWDSSGRGGAGQRVRGDTTGPLEGRCGVNRGPGLPCRRPQGSQLEPGRASRGPEAKGVGGRRVDGGASWTSSAVGVVGAVGAVDWGIGRVLDGAGLVAAAASTTHGSRQPRAARAMGVAPRHVGAPRAEQRAACEARRFTKVSSRAAGVWQLFSQTEGHW